MRDCSGSHRSGDVIEIRCSSASYWRRCAIPINWGVDIPLLQLRCSIETIHLQGTALVNCMGRDSENSLLEACRRGDTESVRALLDGNRSAWYRFRSALELGKKDRNANKPIHIASQFGHDEVLSVLLEKGDSLHTRNSRTGATPLHLASIHGHESTALWCLRHGAKVNEKDLYERTPLHWAAQKGHLPIVKVLVENGADVESLSAGKTPFDLTSNVHIKLFLAGSYSTLVHVVSN